MYVFRFKQLKCLFSNRDSMFYKNKYTILISLNVYSCPRQQDHCIVAAETKKILLEIVIFIYASHRPYINKRKERVIAANLATHENTSFPCICCCTA